MTNIKEQIKQLEESINEINELNNEGEEFDLSFPIDNMNEALAIIKKLQQELWVVKANSDDCDNWNQQLREENEKLKAKDKTCPTCELCVCMIAHG